MHGFGDIAVRLRQQGGAGDRAVLFALAHGEVGEDDLRVLFQREYDGIAKGELERLLGETGKREEQRERELGHVHCW